MDPYEYAGLVILVNSVFFSGVGVIVGVIIGLSVKRTRGRNL